MASATNFPVALSNHLFNPSSQIIYSSSSLKGKLPLCSKQSDYEVKEPRDPKGNVRFQVTKPILANIREDKLYEEIRDFFGDLYCGILLSSTLTSPCASSVDTVESRNLLHARREEKDLQIDVAGVY